MFHASQASRLVSFHPLSLISSTSPRSFKPSLPRFFPGLVEGSDFYSTQAGHSVSDSDDLLAPFHRLTQRCTAFSGSVNHGGLGRGWPIQLSVSHQQGRLNRRRRSQQLPSWTWSNPSRRRFLPSLGPSPRCGPVSAQKLGVAGLTCACMRVLAPAVLQRSLLPQALPLE